MSTYVIGDLHGCYAQLEQLLHKINFSTKDRLWVTGDLVNGGMDSVAVIQFLQSLGERLVCVLGNHDLSLLAVAHYPELLDRFNDDKLRSEYGFGQILQHPDCQNMLDWLSKQRLAYFSEEFQVLLVHAGVHPSWDLQAVLSLAAEVEQVLPSAKAADLYKHIYGDHPDNWSDELTGYDRLRCIINCLTRIRICKPNGQLLLSYKNGVDDIPAGYQPWYKLISKLRVKVIFGHWAALFGETNIDNVIAMDTGCMWGNTLSAMRLEDGQKFCVSCSDLK